VASHLPISIPWRQAPWLAATYIERTRWKKSLLALEPRRHSSSAPLAVVSKMSANNTETPNDATAALKGMLGLSIGSGGQGLDPSSAPTSSPPPKEKKKKSKKGKKPQPNNGNANNKTPKSKQQTKKKGKQNKDSAPENFAWSAFQSSPDASKLPIPAFSPAKDSKPVVNSQLQSLLASNAMQPNIAAAAPPELENAPRAEDLEERLIQQSKQDKKQQQSSPPRPEPPVSSTGINLAAKMNITQTPAKAPQIQPSTPNAMPPMPPPPMPPHMPPAGYITLQVQVPPGLGANRALYVNTPSGYPIQVTVPPNVPPGAVLPVHVPMVPPHMQPPRPS